MKLETLEQLEPLLKRRAEILKTLWHIEQTKEFLNLRLEGENGSEESSAVTFTWEKNSTIPKKIRQFMLDVTNAELKEVEDLIEKL